MTFLVHRRIRLSFFYAAVCLASCSKVPVEWDWDLGPPGPLTVTPSSAFVGHGASVTLTASGGLRRYTFTKIGTPGVLTSSGSTATYTASAPGTAETVTIRVEDGFSPAVDVPLTIPNSGDVDPRCGSGGNDYRTIDLCPGCDDAVRAITVDASNRIVVLGTSDSGGTLEFFASRYTGDALDVDPTFGTGGVLRFNAATTFSPPETNNALDVPAAMRAASDNSLVFSGRLAGSGRTIVGRILPNGTLDTGFGPSGALSDGFNYFAPSLYLDQTTGRMALARASGTTQFIVVPFVYGVGLSSPTMTLSMANPNTLPGNQVTTAEAASSPFVLPLADGSALVGGKSHDTTGSNPLYMTFFGTNLLTTPFQHPGPDQAHSVQDGATGNTVPSAAASRGQKAFLSGSRGLFAWAFWTDRGTATLRRGNVGFSGGDFPSVEGAALEPTGDPVIAGTITNGGTTRGFLHRFIPLSTNGLQGDSAFGGLAGTLDPVFAVPPGNHSFHALAKLPDGRYVVAGRATFTPDEDVFLACVWP